MLPCWSCNRRRTAASLRLGHIPLWEEKRGVAFTRLERRRGRGLLLEMQALS